MLGDIIPDSRATSRGIRTLTTAAAKSGGVGADMRTRTAPAKSISIADAALQDGAIIAAVIDRRSRRVMRTRTCHKSKPYAIDKLCL
jgi:hypothetical protein